MTSFDNFKRAFKRAPAWTVTDLLVHIYLSVELSIYRFMQCISLRDRR